MATRLATHRRCVILREPPFPVACHCEPTSLGGFPMELIESKSIFSPATGFIKRGGFEWTCNPYVGCTFGCTYCYAMFLPQNRRPKENWGKWFQAKINAIELAHK